MFVPFHGGGIISQFEGYEALEELDWDGYRAKYGNIQRLDRILRAEGKDPNRYKIAKRPTRMLFFLFSPANSGGCSSAWAMSIARTPRPATSRTTTSAPRTAPR